ncbi:PucR family transcriptional regulator [Clostridium lundense]|uniref:PucR family transcriptional regulator n=1 Tax=Clostridium lundense TaxID=319475 RepID=UPI0004802F50|nr:PucR family transcriptional regulator ligand-binding domain-containing protein [Clostridium lundense]
MALTVQEALELDILKGFEVIAGKKGLSNEITNVAIWDYEIGDLIAKNFRRGDFALSTLVAIKDGLEELYEIVERMIEVGVSCLAIKNIYFNYIPDEVIKLGNEKNFPIMIFSDTFTEDVIVHVNKAINEKNEYKNLELKIDNILYDNLNDSSIKKIAHNININFKEKNVVAFCKKKNRKLINRKDFFDNDMEQHSSKVIPYKDGYIFINTFEELKRENINDVILRRLRWCGFTEKEYVIGVSGLHEDLGNLNNSIQESLYAFKYSITYKKDIAFFKEIGINKIILPLIDSPWVLKYYNEVIEPLIMYDKNNETELLKTAVKYIENNGDIKATAKELFQHDNTIRYRIDKIDKIMSEKFKSEHFYEELAVAVRIYTLLKSHL